MSYALVLLAAVANAGEREHQALMAEGKRLFDARDYAAAAAVAQRALEEAERTYGAESDTALRTGGYLALALSASLRHEEAIAIYRGAAAVLERRADLRSAAMAHNNIGGEHSRLGDYAAAAEEHRAALAMREKALGPQHPDTAASLTHLALALGQQGRYGEAAALLRRALAIWEQGGGAQLVYGLNNLALLHVRTGRFDEAEPLFRRALALVESLPGQAAAATMLSANYAAALGEQGRHAEAEDLLRRTLAARERSLGAEHFGTAQTLRNLGAALAAQDKHADAEAALRRALAVFEKLRMPDPLEAAKARHLLAQVLNAQRRHGEAEPLAAQALADFERVLGPRHPETADKSRALARALLERGATREALALYLRAVDTLRTAGNPRALLLASSDTAHVLHGAGLLEQALPYYETALEMLEALFARTSEASEEDRYRFLAQYAYLYPNALKLLLELQRRQPKAGHDRRALATASRNQSRIFSEMLRRADVARFAREPAFVALKRSRDQLALEIDAVRASGAVFPTQHPASAKVAASAEARAAALGEAVREVEERLWREFPRYMELAQPRAVGVQDLQTRFLRPGEALLCFAVLPENTLVFALTRERFQMAIRDFGRAELARRIAAVRAPAEDRAPPTALDPAELHYLYRELVAPVEGTLAGSARVLVVGDGPLNTLPLEMLVTGYDEAARRQFEQVRSASGSAGRPFLAEYGTLAYLGARYRFAYLPSLAALASQRGNPRIASGFERELVSFADPVFEPGTEGKFSDSTRSLLKGLAASGTVRSGSSLGLARLPDTAGEARTLARIVGGESRLYLRGEAQEATLKKLDLRRTRYLHFATHGLLGGEFLEIKEILAGGKLAGRRPEPALVLTLAGAEGGEDGLLTMQEVVAGIELDAELVVLSACNTAGETERAVHGEGFAGLTRAFMFAGARGLLVSHWPVETHATVELISETFRQLKAGKPAAEALHAARRHVAASRDGAGGRNYSWEHPSFWAPFVYVGD